MPIRVFVSLPMLLIPLTPLNFLALDKRKISKGL